MKEAQKKSSKNKKIFKKGVDKCEIMLYNRHINFILTQNSLTSIPSEGGWGRVKVKNYK